MVIISIYDLDTEPDSQKIHVRGHEAPRCPDCSAKLKSFGYRQRKVSRGDGSEVCLVIRRLRCPCCHHVHHELPDFVIPYKRYEAEVIEKILCCAAEVPKKKMMKTETPLARHTAPPDYPCESSTALRLRIWFLQLLFHLSQNQVIQNKILKVLNIFKLSLETLKETPQGWLKELFRVLTKKDSATRIA